MKNPNITTPDRVELEKAYYNALANKKGIFIFEGKEYLVGYAKFLIEYLRIVENDTKTKTSRNN